MFITKNNLVLSRCIGPRAIETCSKSVSALENAANTDSKTQRRVEGTLSEHSRKVETMRPNC